MTGATRYLDLPDFLLIAEAVLQTDVDALIRVTDLQLAASALDAPSAQFGGVEFHPAFPDKVAVLCSRIIRNHPLPDGNKRVGYMCAVEPKRRHPDDGPQRVREGAAREARRPLPLREAWSYPVGPEQM